MEFFPVTSLSFSQTMSMVWRILLVLDRIKTNHVPYLSIEDLPLAYHLRSNGSSRFLLFSTCHILSFSELPRMRMSGSSSSSLLRGTPSSMAVISRWSADFRKLAPPTQESDTQIKAIKSCRRSKEPFYLAIQVPASILLTSCLVRIYALNIPAYVWLIMILLYDKVGITPFYVDSTKVLATFDLEELDSFSKPALMKKEPSVSTSSKPSAAPKPSTLTRSRASRSKKRKGSDPSATAVEAFSYDGLGFMESIGPMTTFLNQGLDHLVLLHNEACEAVKVLEAKLKKAKITIEDQGKIVATKTQHYEDKLKKVTRDVEVELAAVQVNHKQEMV
ncbi:hypothetical protein Hanom_Chr17g01585821 [Helianthus anomalus]